MGSKLTLLLGLLVGAFLTLMCINENKTALSLKHNLIAQNDATLETIPPATTAVTPVEPEKQTKETIVELDEPMFSYSIKDTTQISVKLSEDDKTSIFEEFILKYCPSDKCTQDLSFDDHTKKALWQSDALKIAGFLKDNNVKNGAISINGQLFNLEGELQNETDMEKLNKLLEAFDPEVFKMENLTTIAQPSEEETDITLPTTFTEKTQNLQKTQEEISSLLKTNPVYFKFNSTDITEKSKKTLDKILEVLNSINNIKLTVEGHTDAQGDAVYNKLLSQKRAEAVKEYLLSHGDKNRDIEAVGYGEERPISSNPNEKINRRVEIHLKGGE
jgi:outer membrane protein OmpA-like peptidoglycan-associated protein